MGNLIRNCKNLKWPHSSPPRAAACAPPEALSGGLSAGWRLPLRHLGLRAPNLAAGRSGFACCACPLELICIRGLPGARLANLTVVVHLRWARASAPVCVLSSSHSARNPSESINQVELFVRPPSQAVLGAPVSRARDWMLRPARRTARAVPISRRRPGCVATAASGGAPAGPSNN